MLKEKEAYRLKTSRDRKFWAGIAQSKVNALKQKGEFDIVLGDGKEEYSIPFRRLEGLLTEQNLAPDKRGRKRWVVNIVNDRFTVSTSERGIYVGHLRKVITQPVEQAPAAPAVA